MHAPTSVVNGEACIFLAETLPKFGGFVLDTGGDDKGA